MHYKRYEDEDGRTVTKAGGRWGGEDEKYRMLIDLIFEKKYSGS